MNEQEKTENKQYIPNWSRSRHLEAIEDTDFMYLMIEAYPDFRPVGYTILSGIESDSKNIDFRQLVITEKGKGFGREALKLSKQLAFEKFRAHRIRLEIWTHNPHSMALCKSEGLFEEGLVRDCVRENYRYLSYIIMSMLESEYYV
jgi:diamine N-acetyltransferase